MLWIFIILSLLSFIAYRYFTRTKITQVDDRAALIDTLTNRAKQLGELAEYFAVKFDQAKRENDSLRKAGTKTIVKWKQAKASGDTVVIVKTCDTLAAEYAEFIAQTDTTMKIAQETISKLRYERDVLYELDSVKSKLIEDLKDANKGLQKLAKRRGRPIEW